MPIGNLVVARAADWTGIYVGGVLAAEGRGDPLKLLAEAGVRLLACDNVWLQKREGMPYRLADLKRVGE